MYIIHGYSYEKIQGEKNTFIGFSKVPDHLPSAMILKMPAKRNTQSSNVSISGYEGSLTWTIHIYVFWHLNPRLTCLLFQDTKGETINVSRTFEKSQTSFSMTGRTISKIFALLP